MFNNVQTNEELPSPRPSFDITRTIQYNNPLKGLILPKTSSWKNHMALSEAFLITCTSLLHLQPMSLVLTLLGTSYGQEGWTTEFTIRIVERPQNYQQSKRAIRSHAASVKLKKIFKTHLLVMVQWNWSPHIHCWWQCKTAMPSKSIQNTYKRFSDLNYHKGQCFYDCLIQN